MPQTPRLPAPPDSLRAALAAAPATGPARIDALLRVAAACSENNDPLTVAYCRAANAEARRLHRPADQGRAYDELGNYQYSDYINWSYVTLPGNNATVFTFYRFLGVPASFTIHWVRVN